jgi:hypothetical protein
MLLSPANAAGFALVWTVTAALLRVSEVATPAIVADVQICVQSVVATGIGGFLLNWRCTRETDLASGITSGDRLLSTVEYNEILGFYFFCPLAIGFMIFIAIS